MWRRGIDVTVTFLLTLFVTLLSTASPRTFGLELRRQRRHTPFLPGDYWKDNRPDFGSTETTLNVMENSTAKFKCPISHVADSSVSLRFYAFTNCFYCVTRIFVIKTEN